MASVYPQLLIPTATRHARLNDERLVLGSGRTEMLLPLEAGRHFFDERLPIYGEVGYNVVFDGSDEHSWIAGRCFGRSEPRNRGCGGENVKKSPRDRPFWGGRSVL